jgi:hypothetical protein
MSNIEKSWKTSLTAVATFLLGVSVFVMWWFGKIEVEGLAIGLVAVLYFSNLVGGLISKDADQTHSIPTINSTVDPVREFPDTRG